MSHYYFHHPARFSLEGQVHRIATCKMVKGMLWMNIGILFLIPILDLILDDMPYRVGILLLIFTGMFLYVCLLTWLTGHWNRRKQRMELSSGINVLIMIVLVLWVVSFFLHVFGGVGGWVLYAVPVGMSLFVLLIAIIVSVMGQLHR